MSEAPGDPMRAAQLNMRPSLPKRFYAQASVGENKDGLNALLLDGRPARTPGGREVAVRRRAIAEAVAREWREQDAAVDPSTMPATRIVNSALDGVAANMARTRAEIANYAASDLLCYRAEGPPSLVERQAAAFDRVLDWADEELGARLALSVGVVPVAQPAEALDRLRAALDSFDDPIALAALHVMTTLTGSALLALAIARGALGAEEAWRAAHLDEDFQIERWGEDEEARRRRDARWRDMRAAAEIATA
jgi:chaperone required for assembly of F1-ATPase